MAAASAFAAYPRILCLPSSHLNPSPHFSLGLGIGDSSQILARGKTIKAKETVRARAFWNQHEEKPASVEMEPISTPEQLDQLLAQDQNPIIIDWMATWCRKCIYLKPKLEKLAAEFYPKIKFYYVNVNAVPQALVKRGGVSKMPTIQLWKNGEMKAEVIGGHKGWLVVDEVREMIERN